MASATNIPRIIELAATILAAAAKIQEVLSAQCVPSPSFDEDAPLMLRVELADQQDATMDATSELRDLWLDREPSETGYVLASEAPGDVEGSTIYDVLSRHPDRARRFSAAMAVFATKPDNHLSMASAFNARERTLAEWNVLIASADPRFVVNNVIEPEGSALGIIEIV
ncbi:hypothetical protein B0H63DRAFT_516098 [Podospora didyma]|uniref:Uncharacterized protein n=1 Tax=Podospora didyma TaxID=330526 RepID=A0AAE0P3Z9_9PEZI|nr:hypothetical protein B0H63DRAFT_516098 [Podospora didyma]